MSANPMSLPDVAETGMLTFYCHVIESQTMDPILQDEKAVEIAHQLNPVFARASSRLLRNLARGKVKNELVVHNPGHVAVISLSKITAHPTSCAGRKPHLSDGDTFCRVQLLQNPSSEQSDGRVCSGIGNSRGAGRRWTKR